MILDPEGNPTNNFYVIPVPMHHQWQEDCTRLIFALANKYQEETIEPAGMYHLAMALVATGNIPGDIVEIGVYRGQSADLICRINDGFKQKPVHLFDTFIGVPEINTTFDGRYICSLEQVKKNLGEFSDKAMYHEGLFPMETGSELIGKKISFAHIDVDTGPFTYRALSSIYPRMSVGGAILVHDYDGIPEVRNSVDEFVLDKRCPIFSLGASQALLIKTEE
jgi:O-methyltransferase